MAAATSYRIGRDEVVWSFGPNMEPVLEVEPGSMITLETNDCFTGQIQTEADLVTEIDFERVNSATWFAWGVLIAVLIAPRRAVEAGCLVLAFGDPAARG